MKEYLENRIKELNEADARFCKDRWDMTKPAQERNLYREESNKVTFARQELEAALKHFNSLNISVGKTPRLYITEKDIKINSESFDVQKIKNGILNDQQFTEIENRISELFDKKVSYANIDDMGYLVVTWPYSHLRNISGITSEIIKSKLKEICVIINSVKK